MSFESGFNTGANIAASLRSSANQRRSLDLQEKRDEVNKLATEQLIAKRATDMKNAETVRKRLDDERVSSETVLGYFSSEAGKLKFNDPEDVTTYRDLVGYTISNIKDPQVLQRFGQVNDMYTQKYAYKRQIDKGIKAEEKSALYEKKADNMYLKTGITVDSDTPQGQSQIDAFDRREAAYAALTKAGKTWDDAGVDGYKPGLSSDEFAKINQFLMDVGKEQAILDNMTDQQKNAKMVQDKIGELGGDADLIDQVKATKGSNELKQSEQEAISQAFVALDLAVSAERQMKNLGIPFQGSAFSSFFADLKRNAAAFSNQTSDNLDSFRATITQLVPVLAKGVFQETGVLTDEDVRRYSATIASIENTPESNERVMSATQSLIARLTRNQLKRAVEGGINVSRYAGDIPRLSSVPTQAYWLGKDIPKDKIDETVHQEIYQDLVVSQIIFPGETVKYRVGDQWKTVKVPQKSFYNKVNASN